MHRWSTGRVALTLATVWLLACRAPGPGVQDAAVDTGDPSLVPTPTSPAPEPRLLDALRLLGEGSAMDVCATRGTDGTPHVYVATRHATVVEGTTRTVLRVYASRDGGQRWPEVWRSPRAHNQQAPALGCHENTLVITWLEQQDPANARLRLVRSHNGGGTFGAAPLEVGSGPIERWQVALDEERVLVAWAEWTESGGMVLLREARGALDEWTEARTGVIEGPLPHHDIEELVLATSDDGGTAWVAWNLRPRASSEVIVQREVHVAMLGEPSLRVDGGDLVGHYSLGLCPDQRGGVWATWAVLEGPSSVVMASHRPRAGLWSTPIPLLGVSTDVRHPSCAYFAGQLHVMAEDRAQRGGIGVVHETVRQSAELVPRVIHRVDATAPPELDLAQSAQRLAAVWVGQGHDVVIAGSAGGDFSPPLYLQPTAEPGAPSHPHVGVVGGVAYVAWTVSERGENAVALRRVALLGP